MAFGSFWGEEVPMNRPARPMDFDADLPRPRGRRAVAGGNDHDGIVNYVVLFAEGVPLGDIAVLTRMGRAR